MRHNLQVYCSIFSLCTSTVSWSYYVHEEKKRGKKPYQQTEEDILLCLPSPVVILFAVNAAVLGEAREFGLQSQFALTALETAQVPLFIHRQ